MIITDSRRTQDIESLYIYIYIPRTVGFLISTYSRTTFNTAMGEESRENIIYEYMRFQGDKG